MTEWEFKEVADASRRTEEFRLHPLGFFYLREDIGQGVTRRIHVWLPNRNDGPQNYRHVHSYGIDSLVVAGKISNALFRFRETAEGPELEFAVSYEPGKSILRPTGKRGILDEIGSFETAAGARYRLDAGVIHSVAVDEVPCVTVLTTIEQGIPIYSYGPADEKQPFLRRMAKKDEAQRIAGALEDTLRP